jgi:hypothetical protein
MNDKKLTILGHDMGLGKTAMMAISVEALFRNQQTSLWESVGRFQEYCRKVVAKGQGRDLEACQKKLKEMEGLSTPWRIMTEEDHVRFGSPRFRPSLLIAPVNTLDGTVREIKLRTKLDVRLYYASESSNPIKEAKVVSKRQLETLLATVNTDAAQRNPKVRTRSQTGQAEM